MALPSAQLGSLGGINVPSFVPVTQVQKQPKLWQQALLSVLASTATNVAGQGVQNAMSRDYAAEPASGFDKLVSGPKKNAAMHLDETRQGREDNRLQARIAGELALQELAAQPGAKEAMMRAENELQRLHASDMQGRSEQSQRAIAAGNNMTSRANNTDDLASRKLLAEAEQTFQRPLREAQTTNLQEESSSKKTQRQLMERAMAQGDQEAARKANGGQEPLTAKQAVVQSRLRDTNKYPVPDLTPTKGSGYPDASLTPNIQQMMGGLSQAAQSNGVTEEQILRRMMERDQSGVTEAPIQITEQGDQSVIPIVEQGSTIPVMQEQTTPDPRVVLESLLQKRGNRAPLGTLPGDAQIIQLMRQLATKPTEDSMFPNAIWNTPTQAPRRWDLEEARRAGAAATRTP